MQITGYGDLSLPQMGRQNGAREQKAGSLGVIEIDCLLAILLPVSATHVKQIPDIDLAPRGRPSESEHIQHLHKYRQFC